MDYNLNINGKGVVIMSDYEKYKDDEDFVEILEYLRENVLASEDEVVDGTDLGWEIIDKYYSIAQAIVAEEIEEGQITDSEGVEIAYGYIDYLTKKD